MQLSQIQELWDADAIIDRSELGIEQSIVPKLHSKYFKLFSQERMTLRSLENEMKRLHLKKYEYYTQGPSKEDIAAGLKAPSIGRIIKSEVNYYIDADSDIIKMKEKLIVQQEKVDFLESIIKNINNRQYLISGMIQWEKFLAGS